VTTIRPVKTMRPVTIIRYLRWAGAACALAGLLAGCGSTPKAETKETGAAPRQAENAASTPKPARTVELSESALAQINIHAVELRSRRVPRVLRTSGRVTMNDNRTWRVGAATDGRVVDIARNVGDTVKAGAQLARIFSHDIHEARAEYARAKSELQRLQNRRDYLRTMRDRTRRLYELKAASLQQLQEAEMELKNAEGEIGNGETELERTRFHLVEYLRVDLNHKDTARIDGYEVSDLIPVFAPASGIIVERNVTPGTVVQSATDLFVISDMSTVWLIAAVQQQDLSLINIGMPVRVVVPSYPDSAFNGRVSWVGSELDPATRTVSVRVELPNPGFRLRPEMYATAEISLDDTAEGLFVNQEALQEIGGQMVLFVEKSPGHFEVRSVSLGQELDGQRQILSGVRVGDRVVADGSFLLKSKLLESSLAE